MENTVHLFAPNAEAKGLRLHVTVDPHLPAIVCGDPQRLAQIVCNLVDNAIKFTPHGQVRVRVQALDQDAQRVTCRLQVEDTGIGIPETHQASIFSAFNQVDASTTRQQGGTGLGLAICQQLTTLMQGRLGVQSAAGQGSTFWVELPLPLATTAAAASADQPAPNRDPEPDLDPTASDDTPISARRLSRKDQGEPARVLVVDDHETNRAYAKIALAQFHADVVLVENGQAALEACQRQHFDLILMDIRMPGLDGLETTRRIRRWRQNPNGHTPILGLTADVLNTHRQNWQAAGMNDCLFKPLGEEALSAALAPWGIRPVPETATTTPDKGETPA
jgi:CheY-like chemotaxis protein